MGGLAAGYRQTLPWVAGECLEAGGTCLAEL